MRRHGTAWTAVTFWPVKDGPRHAKGGAANSAARSLATVFPHARDPGRVSGAARTVARSRAAALSQGSRAHYGPRIGTTLNRRIKCE